MAAAHQGSKFIFRFGSTCATRCKFLGAQLQVLQIVGAPTPKEYLHSKMSDSGFILQYGPILAALNTMKTNERIRIHVFHTRVKLRYILTAEVASLSIVTIQLLVACLAFEIMFTKSS